MDRFFIKKPMSEMAIISDKEDIKHITKVLRLRVGDQVEIVDGLGQEYRCILQSIEKEEVAVCPQEKVRIDRELPVRIKLYQGIPKGQKMELIVQKATELGVSEIYPINFHRCVSQLKEEKEDKKIKRYEKIAHEAAKQSKRTKLPVIHSVIQGKDLWQEMQHNDWNLLFYENESGRDLKDFFRNNAKEKVQTIGILIGPEGGLTEEEVALLEKEGCAVLSLGNRILRTETAGMAAIAIIAYEFGKELRTNG